MKRKRPPEDTAEGISNDYRYPSELIEGIEESRQGLDSSAATRLRQNREDAVLRDKRFRDKHVKFEHAEQLVDKKSTETNEDGIPARNRIRRIVEDLMSVVLPNVPDATLRADAPIDPDLPKEERRLKEEYLRHTEKTANRAVKGLLERSDADGKMGDIVEDAIIDGVGYAHPRMENLANRREQRRLDSLLMKEDWGPEEIDQFAQLTRQPRTGHVEAREVFWREGIRSVDEDDMTRASRVRDVDLQWLRDYYNDADIQAGRNEDHLWLDPVEDSYADENARAGYAETWQIEEFVAQKSSKFLMSSELTQAEATWSVDYTDAILVYTAITTNKLLEYRIYTAREIPIELPFVPFYIKTSKRHPYGFSVPLMLELQQKFANEMLAVLAEQAMNSISPSAFAVFLEALGAQDREEIEAALQEGGAAFLEGNDTGNINEIIQQFPNANEGPNNAIASVMRSEEQAMMREGQALSPSMLSGARSAAGKQAIQSAADRPKQYSILNIAASQEDHYERLYQMLQRAVGQEEMIMPVPGQDAVAFNRKERRAVVERTQSGRPMTLDSMKSKRNPAGVVWREEEFTKGDLTVPMNAKADTRGMWPTGMQAKLRLASAMAEAGVLTSQKTVRELVLDERTRLRDDRNRMEEQRGQGPMADGMREALQQVAGSPGQGGAQAQNGAQTQGSTQGSAGPGGGAPPGDATEGGTRGSQNPALAGTEQNGMQQVRAGGGAGPAEEQVGQGRRAPSEEQARREAEI